MRRMLIFLTMFLFLGFASLPVMDFFYGGPTGTRRELGTSYSNLIVNAVSATAAEVVYVEGTVACEQYTSGPIYVYARDENYINLINIIEISSLGSYSLPIDTAYVGQYINVYAYWDKDGSKNTSAGDYLGEYEGNPLLVKDANSGINLILSELYSATISGSVTCEDFTTGLIRVSVLDGPDIFTSN